MSNLKEKLTFDINGLFMKGSLDVSKAFRESMSQSIRQCKYSREEIVDLVEVLTNQRISKYILDQSTSSKVEYRIPAEILHAICFITGSLEPFRILLNSIGCEVLAPQEQRDLKLLRLMKEKERIEKEIEKLKKEEV
jgi:hypothetical protein